MSSFRPYRNATKSRKVVRKGGTALRQYWLYELDERSRVFRASTSIDADDDGMAAEMAAGLLNQRAIEIWEGRRIVSRLKPIKPKPASVAN
jgi:hypothetical protein